jgi:hypothetical protein
MDRVLGKLTKTFPTFYATRSSTTVKIKELLDKRPCSLVRYYPRYGGSFSFRISPIMKMEVADSFKMSVMICPTIHYHIPEGSNVHTRNCENLKWSQERTAGSCYKQHETNLRPHVLKIYLNTVPSMSLSILGCLFLQVFILILHVNSLNSPARARNTGRLTLLSFITLIMYGHMVKSTHYIYPMSNFRIFLSTVFSYILLLGRTKYWKPKTYTNNRYGYHYDV